MKQPGSFTVHTGHAGPLFYAEAGSGYPLLLLHGNGEDHTYFSAQLRFFSQYYHVFAPDTRGHGADRRQPAEYAASIPERRPLPCRKGAFGLQRSRPALPAGSMTPK